jgi:hypothetical protein
MFFPHFGEDKKDFENLGKKKKESTSFEYIGKH